MPALKDAAAKIGLAYGSDSDEQFGNAPTAYQALFVEQCALYAGLFLWPPHCAKGDDSCPPFIDPNLNFVLQNGLRITGGHLMYHQDTPEWIADLGSPREAERVMIRHINDLAGRYAGHVFSWNVFNETLNPREGRPDGLRHTATLRALGFDMFEIGFRAARAADPHALLAMNDYSLEMAAPEDESRRTAMLRWLDLVQRKGVPVDAIGIQSHLAVNDIRFDPERFRRFLHEIASRGLAILLTELDVLDAAPRGSVAQRDAAVAAMYAEFLRTALDEPAVAAVVSWGLSDRYTWLTPQRNKEFAREDGQPVRPLPFDAEFQPKPAFQAILAAFEHAPARAPLPRRGQPAGAPANPSRSER